MMTPLSRRDVDRGQVATLLVGVVAVLLVVVVVALATMGGAVLDRTRAQTAADAAALASLDGGHRAAVDMAGHHDGTVVAWQRGPGMFEVTVTIRVGGSTATARASNAP